MRTDEWGTPDWLWRTLDDEFRFDLDAAAATWNAKCTRYLTQALDREPWPGNRVFLNPPYSRGVLVRFLDRVILEADRDKLIVAVLPVRSDTDWWADQVVAAAREIRFVRRRVAFVPPPGHAVGRELSNRPMYASAIVIYGPGRRTIDYPTIATMEGRSVRRTDWHHGTADPRQGSLW